MQRAMVTALLLVAAEWIGPSALVAEDAPPAAVRFLTQKEAMTAIVDESIEPYFSLLQPLEMTAKTCTTPDGAEIGRASCRERV